MKAAHAIAAPGEQAGEVAAGLFPGETLFEMRRSSDSPHHTKARLARAFLISRAQAARQAEARFLVLP